MDILFRSGQLDDVPTIVDLVESAYRGEASRVGWTTEADLLGGQRTDAQEVTQIINDAESHVILAELKGRIIATVHLKCSQKRCELGMLAVKPELQNQGIGRSILEQAERYAMEVWLCDSMQMAVIVHRHELIAWYRRLGYQQNGEFRPFPYGDERYGLPKRSDLRFLMLAKRL
ncbi:MAG: GNAT family N-acetyltransferase [Gammaproteobacteria bacterium]|nr:GNAT family N-acetyltransferase [Gammaproteobacteria bacterium]